MVSVTLNRCILLGFAELLQFCVISLFDLRDNLADNFIESVPGHDYLVVFVLCQMFAAICYQTCTVVLKLDCAPATFFLLFSLYDYGMSASLLAVECH